MWKCVEICEGWGRVSEVWCKGVALRYMNQAFERESSLYMMTMGCYAALRVVGVLGQRK